MAECSHVTLIVQLKLAEAAGGAQHARRGSTCSQNMLAKASRELDAAQS